MTATYSTLSTVLVAIDISKHRHEMLIGIPGKKRRRRITITNSLALQVQEGLGRDPHAGEIFCFRGRKGDLVKILWHDGVGMSLYLKWTCRGFVPLRVLI